MSEVISTYNPDLQDKNFSDGDILVEGEEYQQAADFCNLTGQFTIEETDPAADGTPRYKVVRIPDPTFEEVRAEKMQELESKAAAFEENLNKDMFFSSSVGFRVNGDRRTRSNIEDLIAFSRSFPVSYRDYDNVVREVTKEQLQVMLVEHITNGNSLYTQKWDFEARINAAATIEELKAIDLTFTMMDFGA